MRQPELLKLIFCVEQWELTGSKNNCTVKSDITLWQNKSILKLDRFLLSVFHNGSRTKNRFQQLWMYGIFKHCKLPCIPCLGETHTKLQWLWYNIFPSLVSFFFFCNAPFFNSGYAIKPLPFTELCLIQGHGNWTFHLCLNSSWLICWKMQTTPSLEHRYSIQTLSFLLNIMIRHAAERSTQCYIIKNAPNLWATSTRPIHIDTHWLEFYQGCQQV